LFYGLAVILAAVTSSGCSQNLEWSAVQAMVRSSFPSVNQISTDSLSVRLADSTAARPVILDVRTPEEFAVSHLAGAIRVDPDAVSFPELLSLDRNTPIVAYCSVGYRSSRVVERLLESGFADISNLEGSIFKWSNEGRPIVDSLGPAQQVHAFDKTWGKLLNEDLRAGTAN
jgi:rhodanese-related sulfurtransferase